MSDDSRLQSIERFGVPLVLMITMLASTAMLASSNAERFGRLEHSVDMLRHELGALSRSVDGGMSQAQMRAWVAEFRASNREKGITVPDLQSR